MPFSVGSLTPPLSATSIWNDYWHFDRLSSFDIEGRTNYPPELAERWVEFFGTLPGSSAILDLCTGNGAIAVLAVETSRRRDKAFTVAAVDSADINPCLYVTERRDELAEVDFRPGTAIEALPWPNDSFDAIVSQFGLEYSDLSRSIPEVARVISPGGRVRFSLHAAEGEVVGRSRRVISDLDFLIEEVGVAAKACACLRAAAAVEQQMDRSVNALARLKAHTETLSSALQRISSRVSTAADPDLLRTAIRMLVRLYERRRQDDLAFSLGCAQGIEIEWRNHRARLAAQVGAAVTREGRDHIADQLRQHGAWRVVSSEQLSASGLAAHCVEAGF